MVLDGEKWHYLAVKRLSALLRGIKSTNKRDLTVWNTFVRKKLQSNGKVC